MWLFIIFRFYFFFQAEDGIRYSSVTGVQTCALPISFPGTTVSSIQSRVWVDNTTGGTPTNIILNRLHILGSGFNNVLYYGVAETKGSNITLQNSVVGEYYGGSPPSEAVGVSFEQGSNNHIVNNEIYDYAGHPIQKTHQ